VFVNVVGGRGVLLAALVEEAVDVREGVAVGVAEGGKGGGGFLGEVGVDVLVDVTDPPVLVAVRVGVLVRLGVAVRVGVKF